MVGWRSHERWGEHRHSESKARVAARGSETNTDGKTLKSTLVKMLQGGEKGREKCLKLNSVVLLSVCGYFGVFPDI